MHQLLRDMGREIVRQESPKEPGKRSRLWRHKDGLNVLREKTGTATVEGLILEHVIMEDMPARSMDNTKHHPEKSTPFYDGNSSKRRRLGLFSWLPINFALTESFSKFDIPNLETDTFSCMYQLRLLQLNNVGLTGSYQAFPKKLRWLCWHGFSLKVIPNDFPLESLVVLDIRNSSLEQFWKGTKLLRLLKILNLSHSYTLTNSPDFSQLPNLERLILKDCINLVEIHESIGELERLVLLNLKRCQNLRKLPSEIVQLNALEFLILFECSRLHNLPPNLDKMVSLKVLLADGINKLPSTTGMVKPWHELVWSWLSKPRRNPESMCFTLTSLPCSLVSLSLENCNISGDGIPWALGHLSLLHELNLSGNPIYSLPESIRGLTRLHTLELECCTRLLSLPELPMGLARVSVNKCRSLETVTNLPNLFRRLTLDVAYCDKLVEVKGLFKLETIVNIDLEMLNKLGMAELASMRMLEVELFNNLTYTRNSTPGLQGLYECGIYSIFLPGSEIPSWFSYKTRGSSISFTVPRVPNVKICGLNTCVVYAHTLDFRMADWWYEYVTVSNRSKSLKWTYRPVFKGIAHKEKDMIWLSDWKIVNQLMGSGDEVNVAANMAELFQVKEFGIHIMYHKHEEQGTQCDCNDHCDQNVIDLSPYQMTTGEYFLCNHDEVNRGQLYSRIGGSHWDF